MIFRLIFAALVGLGLTASLQNSVAAPTARSAAQMAAPAPDAVGYAEARTVLALYDSRLTPDPRQTRASRFAAMPLNHIGLKVRFWDLAKGLPTADAMNDVRGVLAWLYSGGPLDAKAYLTWADRVIASGRRFLLMGNVLGAQSESDDPEIYAMAQALIAKLGVQLGHRYAAVPYKASFPIYDRTMTGFEWDVARMPMAYQESALAKNYGAQAYLSADAGAPLHLRGVLVATSANGGYVQAGYEMSPNERARWIVNPFQLFAEAFATNGLPKPDVTTVVGRRIYYSHIDGDGWRSLTKDGDAAGDGPTMAASIILDKAIRAYPDLPVTVAPIIADLDETWLGSEPAIKAAREIFLEPQVEAAHHTYSHPFAWGFFEDYDEALERRMSGSGGYGRLHHHGKKQKRAADDPLLGYDAARAYAQYPFDLDQEMAGAKLFLETLLPPGKHVEMVQWSGNTRPFAAAIRAADQSGLRNINGGDTRLDPEFPSVATVAPIAANFDGVRQIYTSASNENTYTELWTRRFHGFRYVVRTFRNTEAPRRLVPVNVYYHMYSGARTEALAALVSVLDAVREAEVAPVNASDYVRIAEGFHTATMIRLGPQRWRVEGRGALNTIRIDDPSAVVDYVASQGVLGHRLVNRSLYIALDRAYAAPVIALRSASGPITPERPVLTHGRWPSGSFAYDQAGFSFSAAGFGDGAYEWRAIPAGQYRISARRNGQNVWTGDALAGSDGRLLFTVMADAITGLEISVRRLSRAGDGA